MSDLILRLIDILPDGRACALSRAIVTTNRPKSLHSHEFFELLWVQNGRIKHVTPTGATDLSEGDLLFVQPQHTHGLQGRGSDAMVVSVSLHPDVVDSILTRHPNLSGRYFWANSPTPPRFFRDIRKLADLNHAAVLLERQKPSQLAAESFLLPLLSALVSEDLDLPATAPGWLTEACNAARDPGVFRDGAAGFVRVAGRAHAHVSRTARQFLAQSPSEYVNHIRMAHAARQLTGTGDSLSEIAADCGIPNLSHFHKLFLAHHGMTPAQFRRMHQRNAVQPELSI